MRVTSFMSIVFWTCEMYVCIKYTTSYRLGGKDTIYLFCLNLLSNMCLILHILKNAVFLDVTPCISEKA
jgi:hypothetical protein